MSADWSIKVDDAEVLSALRRLEVLSAGGLRGVMAEIASEMLASTQRRFELGRSPSGAPWKPTRRGGRMLWVTGRLMRSVYADVDGTAAVIGTGDVRAPWHQFGTRPYTIVPKTKRALSWPGAAHPVARVNHPGLPARPFLGISAEDRQMIVDVAADAVERAAQSRA